MARSLNKKPNQASCFPMPKTCFLKPIPLGAASRVGGGARDVKERIAREMLDRAVRSGPHPTRLARSFTERATRTFRNRSGRLVSERFRKMLKIHVAGHRRSP